MKFMNFIGCKIYCQPRNSRSFKKISEAQYAWQHMKEIRGFITFENRSFDPQTHSRFSFPLHLQPLHHRKRKQIGGETIDPFHLLIYSCNNKKLDSKQFEARQQKHQQQATNLSKNYNHPQDRTDVQSLFKLIVDKKLSNFLQKEQARLSSELN